ncbi:50S ribosomal protein L4 [candidate division WWE3 bacterium]|uniref:Large ribosomal subunit protein uL4 n=1 Tax=candidate division WWE3 bacterium TaxID=2053526 RepID=A0A955LKT4_UNCKA|nr:50S ribosomal protein L4 [candidate division WWE3 bacterium]
MKVKQLDVKSKEIKNIDVSDAIFNGSVNKDLITQYVYIHNKRRALGTRKTKNRGEVAGGGRKPWRQKGTGRARHGSIRSPLWVGGGHAHAITPNPDARIRMPKKMRNAALVSALSFLGKNDKLHFVDGLTLESPKTKDLIEMLKTAGVDNAKVLLVTLEKDRVIEKSAANLTNVNVVEARLLNAYDVLAGGELVFVGKAYELLEGQVS